MKTINLFSLFLILIVLNSCKNPILQIQGIYTIDKNSLRECVLKQNTGNSFVTNMIDVAMQNVIVEFEIKDDSLNGLVYCMGENINLHSKISIKNDSMIIIVDSIVVYLIKTTNGLIYRNPNLSYDLVFNKSTQTTLSAEVKQKILEYQKIENERKEFEKNLGKWQKHKYADEFGDPTDDFCMMQIVKGSFSDNYTSKSELTVLFKVDYDDSGNLFYDINLLENNKNAVALNDDYLSLNVKDNNGQIYNFGLSSYGKHVFIRYNYIKKFTELLLTSPDNLKFKINYKSDFFDNEYHFTLNLKDFPEVIKQL